MSLKTTERLGYNLGDLGHRQTRGIQDKVVAARIRCVLEKMILDEVDPLPIEVAQLACRFSLRNAEFASQHRDAFFGFTDKPNPDVVSTGRIKAAPRPTITHSPSLPKQEQS